MGQEDASGRFPIPEASDPASDTGGAMTRAACPFERR